MNTLYKIIHFLAGFISNTRWGSWRKFFTGRISALSDAELEGIKQMLAKDYYIILTYNKTHLSNWFISLLCLIKTRKWPVYAHALMNVDNITDPEQSDKFKLMEASHEGVDWVPFDRVFDCDRVCLLIPTQMEPAEWTAIIDRLVHTQGRPYDDLYDLVDANRMSCVEVVRYSLQGSTSYTTNFKSFETLIAQVGNLTPQMFRDCPDFKVVLEITK